MGCCCRRGLLRSGFGGSGWGFARSTRGSFAGGRGSRFWIPGSVRALFWIADLFVAQFA